MQGNESDHVRQSHAASFKINKAFTVWITLKINTKSIAILLSFKEMFNTENVRNFKPKIFASWKAPQVGLSWLA